MKAVIIVGAERHELDLEVLTKINNCANFHLAMLEHKEGKLPALERRAMAECNRIRWTLSKAKSGRRSDK